MAARRLFDGFFGNDVILWFIILFLLIFCRCDVDDGIECGIDPK